MQRGASVSSDNFEFREMGGGTRGGEAGFALGSPGIWGEERMTRESGSTAGWRNAA